METIELFLAPFALCLVLAGIHCYLGLHVLARGVIFVDLSLAQVAAVGYTLGALWGLDPEGAGAYFAALACTFLAAALFARARKLEKAFPLEAVIGVVYAFGSAAVILVANRMAHGAEEIKNLLVGQMLWVTWPEVFKTALIYAAVAAVHWIWRRRFFEMSFGEAPHAGLWDFLFYALFGVVITSSVRHAGVLQVFAYLVVPAMMSSLFFTTIRARMAFGWILGAVVSLVGMILSYWLDLPSGAAIVLLFALLPIAAVLAGKTLATTGQ